MNKKKAQYIFLYLGQRKGIKSSVLIMVMVEQQKKDYSGFGIINFKFRYFKLDT